MNNKNNRYELHELSCAGFVVWDNKEQHPILGMYAMDEATARRIADTFNQQEITRLARLAKLYAGAA